MQRTAIIYGDIRNAIEKKALQNLSEMLLQYTDSHPACFPAGAALPAEDHIIFYLGTKENNACIRERSTAVLTHEEEYAIHVEGRTVIIEGYDHAGVLYGVSDFLNKYICRRMYTDGGTVWNPFDKESLPAFDHSEYPKVKNRGFWTWGFTIYDYRAYIDNMVKLKLNTVVIWNDFAPVNAGEIIEYAHAANVRVIWGMPWLWDTNCAKVDMNDLDRFSEIIFRAYEEQYAGVAGDGVYFQTFTELHAEYIGDRLIAEAAADFVNKTSALFFEKYPALELQFGLHVQSVREKTAFIAAVDPRVRIVWENLGAFPFSDSADQIEKFDGMTAFAEKIATLRGADDRFGVVTKGLCSIDWLQPFYHLSGPHFIGIGSKETKQDRLRDRKFMRKYTQSYWSRNAAYAQEAYRNLAALKGGDLYILALVEKSVMEEELFYAAALYAELIWNPDGDVKDILTEISLRDYVECN